MKKVFFFVLAMSVLVSCSIPAKLVNTAAYSENKAPQPMSVLFADLDVSPTKISYFMIPTKTVLAAGEDNVIETAVREALLENGNADVLVSMNKQVKYNTMGEIESVTVTGYPAKYVNFRSPDNEFYQNLKPSDFAGESDQKGGLGKLFKK